MLPNFANTYDMEILGTYTPKAYMKHNQKKRTRCKWFEFMNFLAPN